MDGEYNLTCRANVPTPKLSGPCLTAWLGKCHIELRCIACCCCIGRVVENDTRRATLISSWMQGMGSYMG